jgi:phosphatidylinositol kinase/protein kinase (PI-3  family)
MGPCGTQGTFTHVAESTMRVLRNHSSELLTILSSILADPLYGWRQTRNPLGDGKPNEEREANEDTEERNVEAIKTINKVKEKLSGYEDSTSGEQQGVEGQVQFLINSAREIDKLAQHFGGWMPWV